MTLPKKRYAQYWLRDEGVLRGIVDAAQLTRADTVLEIGPGTGNLTELLLKAAGAVEAIELDATLAPALEKRFPKRPLHVTYGDVLTETLPDCPVVVANIPYYITGPILDKLLGTPAQPLGKYRRIVLLVQKEIAERLSARASTHSYGALSVVVQYLAEVELVQLVPARAFYPKPKVDSAIIALTPHAFIPTAEDPSLFHRLIKQGFSQRRKMLKNTLKPWLDSAGIAQLLTDLGERPDSRAEMLTVAQWVHFANRWRPCDDQLAPPESPDPMADLG